MLTNLIIIILSFIITLASTGCRKPLLSGTILICFPLLYGTKTRGVWYIDPNWSQACTLPHGARTRNYN
jgi:hypothetical protein